MGGLDPRETPSDLVAIVAIVARRMRPAIGSR